MAIKLDEESTGTPTWRANCRGIIPAVILIWCLADQELDGATHKGAERFLYRFGPLGMRVIPYVLLVCVLPMYFTDLSSDVSSDVFL